MKRQIFFGLVFLRLLSPALIASGVYSGGDGSAVTPYLIATGADMQEIGLIANSDDWDKQFLMTADVDLAAYTGTAFNIIAPDTDPAESGHDGTKFTGTFDGDGHTISNFTYSSTAADYIGLFGYLDSDAQVRNVAIVDCNVVAGTGDCVGAIAGFSRASIATVYACPAATNLRDISVTGTAISLGDEEISSAIPLGFNFNFYGTSYSEVYIASNGFVTFLSGQDPAWQPQQIPDAASPNGLIAGYWGDFDPNVLAEGTIVYQLLGSGNNQEFVIGYYDVPHYSDWGLVTFEIILHRNNDEIEVQYGSCPSDGSDHAVGIENIDGTAGVLADYGNISFNNMGLMLCTAAGPIPKFAGGIHNCYVTGSVSGDNKVASLAGWNEGAIAKSYSTAAVSGTDYIASVAGYTSGDISDCYVRGTVNGIDTVGSLAGYNEGDISNSFAAGTVTGVSDVGGFIGYNSNGTYTACFWDNTFNPSLADCGFDDGTFSSNVDLANISAESTANMQIQSTFTSAGWDFPAIWIMPMPGSDYPHLSWEHITFPGGGTQVDPYRISSSAQLNAIGNQPSDWDKHFILTDDIDLTPYTAIPFNLIANPAAKFTGSFNGAGFSISNFTYTSTGTDYIGMFRYIGPGGQVKNLALVNANVNAGTGDYVGILAGSNEGVIASSSVVGDLTANAYVGTIAGKNLDTISNSYAAGNVTGTDYAGGLLGYNNRGTVSNSYANSTVTATINAGGLIGSDLLGDYNDCFWDITVNPGLSDCGYNDLFGSPNFNLTSVTAESTANMKIKATFTSANWDFVDESVSGTDNYWRICTDGIDYPKLAWQSITADITCPDGVGLSDFAYFATRWLDINCSLSNNCGGADLTGDDDVNLADFSILSSQFTN